MGTPIVQPEDIPAGISDPLAFARCVLCHASNECFRGIASNTAYIGGVKRAQVGVTVCAMVRFMGSFLSGG